MVNMLRVAGYKVVPRRPEVHPALRAVRRLALLQLRKRPTLPHTFRRV